MLTPIKRNIVIAGRRTSISLELRFWKLLDEIVRRQDASSRSQIVRQLLHDYGGSARKPAAALRLGIVEYFVSAANELGHFDAKHGYIDPDGKMNPPLTRAALEVKVAARYHVCAIAAA